MRTNPDTSIDAYKSLQPEQIGQTYQLIVNALTVLKAAHSEDIAAFLKMDHSKIWKRLSELGTAGLIYKPGAKKKMKSGRAAYVWALVRPLQSTAKIEIKLVRHRNKSENNLVQKELFI